MDHRPFVSALLCCAGCVETLDEHTSSIGEVIVDCVVTGTDGRPLDAPVSLEYPDASLWLWENGAARVTRVGEACAGGVAVIASPLALAAAEQVDNAGRTDGKQLALVPLGGAVADGVGYLYYDHVVRGPGLFDAEPLGTGLCVLAPGATACERVTDAAGSTVLWRPDQRVLNRGGLIVADAAGPRAVIAGCRKVASFESPCTVTSAPVTALRDPTAYQVWDPFVGWVDTLTDAGVIANELGELTLSAYDDGVLATSMDFFTPRVYVRRGADAVAGYGPPTAAFDPIPPAAWWFVRGGREHAAQRVEPRSIVVSARSGATVRTGAVSWRFGFAGLLELESDGETAGRARADWRRAAVGARRCHDLRVGRRRQPQGHPRAHRGGDARARRAARARRGPR